MNTLNKKIPFGVSFAVIILIFAVFGLITYSQYKKIVPPQYKKIVSLEKNSIGVEAENITNQDSSSVPNAAVSPPIENSPEKINLDFSNDPQKKSLYCNIDSDCMTTLDTCNCKLVCRNKQFRYFDNCLKACTIQEMDFTVQECQCQNNQCVDKTNEPSQ
jgi:hypothetical protein